MSLVLLEIELRPGELEPGPRPHGGGYALATPLPDLLVVLEHVGLPLGEHVEPLELAALEDLDLVGSEAGVGGLLALVVRAGHEAVPGIWDI